MAATCPMNELSTHRRQFLSWAGAASVAGAFVALDDGFGATAGETASDSAESSSLGAVVTIRGREYIFREVDGDDLGDFNGPGFVQRCIRVMRSDLPLTVFFRPDRGSARAEVVFELGRLWGDVNAAAANLPAYHVKITRKERVLAEIDVPRHWWFSAWRWQSAWRPIIRTADYLTSVGALPPFSRKLTQFCQPTTKVRYAGPMDSAGLCLSMGMAGDRPDIGLVTECQAEYILTNRIEALHSLLAQAEAAGSVPWHCRDEVTGAPIDFFKHPMAHWYHQRLNGPYEYVNTTKTEWAIDDAHQPALAYVPYLLTGDPYYLEKLQFQGTYNIGWAVYHREVQRLQVVNPGQTRSFAWGIRTLAQLARITPAVTPKWLLPRSYWKRMLEENRVYFEREYVKNTKPACTVFHAATRQDQVASWQEIYLSLSIGWAVLLGFSEWREAFDWKIASTIALSNGKSGWPRQWCSPYYYKLANESTGKSYQSWREAWEAFKADPANKVVEPFPNRTSWAQNNSFGYCVYTRAALGMAARLGVPEARECFDFVDAMATEGLRKKLGPMSYRWAISAA